MALTYPVEYTCRKCGNAFTLMQGEDGQDEDVYLCWNCIGELFMLSALRIEIGEQAFACIHHVTDAERQSEAEGMMMNEIGFAGNLIPLIISGDKTLTYRLGHKRSYAEGNRLRIRGTQITIVIVHVWQCAFGELPVNDSRHEAYDSVEHMRSVFAGYYGRAIADSEIITVIEFTTAADAGAERGA